MTATEDTDDWMSHTEPLSCCRTIAHYCG